MLNLKYDSIIAIILITTFNHKICVRAQYNVTTRCSQPFQLLGSSLQLCQLVLENGTEYNSSYPYPLSNTQCFDNGTFSNLNSDFNSFNCDKSISIWIPKQMILNQTVNLARYYYYYYNNSRGIQFSYEINITLARHSYFFCFQNNYSTKTSSYTTKNTDKCSNLSMLNLSVITILPMTTINTTTTTTTTTKETTIIPIKDTITSSGTRKSTNTTSFTTQNSFPETINITQQPIQALTNSSINIQFTQNGTNFNSNNQNETAAIFYTVICVLQRTRKNLHNSSLIETVNVTITNLKLCDLMDVNSVRETIIRYTNQVNQSIAQLANQTANRLNQTAKLFSIAKTTSTSFAIVAILSIIFVYCFLFLLDVTILKKLKLNRIATSQTKKQKSIKKVEKFGKPNDFENIKEIMTKIRKLDRNIHEKMNKFTKRKESAV